MILDKNSVPIAAIEAEFDSADMRTYIKNSAGLAADLKMQGVPNFIIGDALYQGYLEVGRMQAIVNDVRSKIPAEVPAAPAPTAPEPVAAAPVHAQDEPKVVPAVVPEVPAASNDKQAK